MATENGGRWFVLGMNDMRASNVERVRPVARARTAEALIELLDRERVEPYVDGQWRKCFRRGGPLEWKNDPEPHGFAIGGIAEVFVVTDAPLEVQVLTEAQAEEIQTIEQLTEQAARIRVIRAAEES